MTIVRYRRNESAETTYEGTEPGWERNQRIP